MFLDDWQWADAASLDLLRKLEVGTTLRYLVLVASYRSNEVDDKHPLTFTLKELNRLSVPVESLPIQVLGATDVRLMLSDALLMVDDLPGLADLVYPRFCIRHHVFY